MSDLEHAEATGHGPTRMSYLVVGFALAVFTICSFVVNGLVRADRLGVQAGFAVILGVAIVKASLVGAYFMHLKFDWRMVYFMLIPVFILGTMMMIVLLPDIVLAWQQY